MLRRMLTPIVTTLLLLGTACPAHHAAKDRTVTYDGRQMTAEDAAREIYKKALLDKNTGHPERAVPQLEGIRKDYRDSSVFEDAALTLAEIYMEREEADKARGVLEDYLSDNPSGERADDARYHLAMAQLATGDAKSAAPALATIVDKLDDPDEKREASIKLAGELLAQDQGEEAARYLARAHALASGQQKADLAARLLDVVDSKIDFVGVRRLLEEEAQKGELLHELLTYKLARVLVHLRDYRSASKFAQQYVDQYPRGRFAGDAKKLKSQLDARVQVEPKTLGIILPLSGKFAAHGRGALSAIQLGFGFPVEWPELSEEEKEEGKVPPEIVVQEKDGIRLVIADSQGNAEVAVGRVNTLVEKHHVVGILGDMLIDTALPVALKGEEYGVPVVSLSRRAGLPELGPWVFRIALTTKKQAQALATMAMDGLGLKRFAILYPEHAYGVEMMNAFWDEVEKREGEIKGIESYSVDQTTFTTEAKKLVGRYALNSRYEYNKCMRDAQEIKNPYRAKKARERCRDVVTPRVDFEAIIIPDFAKTISYVVPALVAEDILVTQNRYMIRVYRETTGNDRMRPVLLMGGNGWGARIDGSTQTLGDRLDRQVDGALFVDGFDTAEGTKRVKEFVKAYREKRRVNPSRWDAQAHDAALLLKAILTGQAGKAPKSRGDLRNQLHTVRDFPGVTGLVAFDKNGDSIVPPVFFTFERGMIKRAEDDQLKRPGEG
jgi:ABC-type branched-subunit amino acid transport system substrate-binding protein/outer membrane protein assembly factor BamD (BamD/ComL family)